MQTTTKTYRTGDEEVVLDITRDCQDFVSGRATGGAAVTGSCQSDPNSAGGSSAAAAGPAPSSDPAASARPASMDMICRRLMRQE